MKAINITAYIDDASQIEAINRLLKPLKLNDTFRFPNEHYSGLGRVCPVERSEHLKNPSYLRMKNVF